MLALVADASNGDASDRRWRGQAERLIEDYSTPIRDHSGIGEGFRTELVELRRRSAHIH